jgi:tetratricopeptide (TPR) repeat protein
VTALLDASRRPVQPLVEMDLSVVPAAETIRRIAAARQSGDLHVRSGKASRMVFFDQGRIVFAASNLRAERLGEAMVRLGHISADQCAKARALVRETPEARTRFGDALVQAGIMDREAVELSVAACLELVLLSLFPLSLGSATFDERPCSIPPDYAVTVPVERVLYTGILTMTSQDLILAGLGDLERRVVVSSNPPFERDARRCALPELAIIERARKPTRVRNLIGTNTGIDVARSRAAYAMLASGLLVPAPADGAVRVTTTADRQVIRREVDRELTLSEAFNPEAWLGLPAGADTSALFRAIDEKLGRYQELRERVAGDEALTADLELVQGRALAMLRAASPSPAAAAPAAPPRVVPPAAPAAPAPAKAAALSTMELEHLSMEANLRMSVGDYRNAIQSYSKLTKLQPEVPAHRLRLAAAMSRWPPTAKQAESLFLDLLGEEPDNPELHFQVGLYYKSMNVASRAIAEFRAVLRLNPRHAKAREELEALAPRESVLKGLKKLLQ